MNINTIKAKFRELFAAEATVIKSPGRINVIGEHTDYNDGFVLPAAIDKAIYVAISKRDDEEIHLFSENYQEELVISLSQVQKSDKTWANFILGVVDELLSRGYALKGFNLYLNGDVPLGAGLSSSAALECATGFALSHLFGLDIAKKDIALIGQQAEHKYAGVNCGIMDQFASVFGKEGQAILLDCRSLDYEYIPLDLKDYKFVLLNSNVKHKHSESGYNTRRMQSEKGVAMVKAKVPEVSSLRDITIAQLEKFVKPYDMEVYIKCRFVVEEIQRTQLAAEKLKAGDLVTLGKLMFETHTGLSKAYEVSCVEIDFLVEQVAHLDYVLGARITGGGFGGCSLNLVHQDKVDLMVEHMTTVYQQKYGITLDAYIVEIGNGTEVIA